MTQFSSYALQLVNFTATSLAATGAQLLIVESGVTGPWGTTLTPAQLASLEAQGRQVLGYVNTSVTDASRSYWNNAWVTPTNPAEPDVGVVQPGAPAWLQNNFGGVDFNAGYPGPEAILVDYREPNWRALVVAQAVAVVQAGFDGVFLDDVGRYFQAGYAGGSYDATLADSMMALVVEVATAIRAIDADAKVVINSGVYIGWDSSGGTGAQLYQDYLAALDGVLIENQYVTEVNPVAPNVLSDAAALFPGVDILPLENRATGLDVEGFLQFAGAAGMLPYISPDETYGLTAPAPELGSVSGDVWVGAAGRAHLMGGLGGNDNLTGAAKADEIYGHAGNDTLSGLGGHDVLGGGAGNDQISGGGGNDTLIGGADQDRLNGGAGNDQLAGGAGNDTLTGGDGTDSLTGGAGRDVLTGGLGADIFTFAGVEGTDRIADFSTAQGDRIDLTAYGTDWAHVSAAMVLKASGVVINLAGLGGSGTITLTGVTSLTALDAGDFLF